MNLYNVSAPKLTLTKVTQDILTFLKSAPIQIVLPAQLKAAVFLGPFVLEYSVFICFISARCSSQQAPLTSACTRFSLTPSSSSVTSSYPLPDLPHPFVLYSCNISPIILFEFSPCLSVYVSLALSLSV